MCGSGVSRDRGYLACLIVFSVWRWLKTGLVVNARRRVMVDNDADYGTTSAAGSGTLPDSFGHDNTGPCAWFWTNRTSGLPYGRRRRGREADCVARADQRPVSVWFLGLPQHWSPSEKESLVLLGYL